MSSEALTTLRTEELSAPGTSQAPVSQASDSHHDLLQLDDIVRGLKFLQRHLWRLAIGVVLGLLAGGYYFVTVAPTYETEAQLLIEKRRALGIDGIGVGPFYHREVAGTHIAVLESPWFISQVIQSRGLSDLSSLSESLNSIKSVKSALTITHTNSDDDSVGDSVVLNLTYQGLVAEECPTVLNAIVESYKSYLDQASRKENEDTLKLITRKAEEVQAELNELEADYSEFIRESPEVVSRERDARYYESRLADLEAEEASLNASCADLERRLAALNAATDDDDRRFAVTLVPDDYKQEAFDIVEGRYETFEEALLPLLIEERKLLTTLGPGHTKVRDVRDQIALTREILTPTSANRRQLLTQADVDYSIHWADPVKTYTEHLKQEYGNAMTTQKIVAERLQRARHQLRDYANYEHKERRFNREIARSQLLYEGLAKQLHGVDLGKDTGGYSTTVLADARLAPQIAPNLFKVIVVSAFLGLVFGGGWMGVSEASNNSFRNISEIHEHLHVPILGQIPVFSCNDGKKNRQVARLQSLDPLVCTYHQPLSVEAEAYRGVRAALLFNQGRQQHQVIQIASPGVGDGKSTLAANLAVSIAQSGKEVLLVDGDLRSPRVHELFGQTKEPGLAAVICDGTELHDAVRSTQIGGLSLLPAGFVSGNPADIFASPRIGELIPVLRERYDFILIDTAPLLAVTESQAIAANVDGVVLAIRPSKKEIPGTRRALDILQVVGANLIGIVVNGTSGCEYDNYGKRYHSKTRQQDGTLVRFETNTPSTTETSVSAAGNSHVQQN